MITAENCWKHPTNYVFNHLIFGHVYLEPFTVADFFFHDFHFHLYDLIWAYDTQFK